MEDPRLCTGCGTNLKQCNGWKKMRQRVIACCPDCHHPMKTGTVRPGPAAAKLDRTTEINNGELYESMWWGGL